LEIRTLIVVLGEGLNVEQRKRLTIAVEMAAKPALLLFLDEPTSGLDSQTAWDICNLLRKLANNGQAILCTIHQPSAILFQSFDRLLFLASGGRTVYFGDIGENSKTLTSYFEKNGSRPCGVEENPAEWMLHVIGAAPGSQNDIDWPQVWRESPEKQNIRETLTEMKDDLKHQIVDDDSTALREFAAPLSVQFFAVSKRVFEQYWRTPSYLYSKVLLCAGTALFIGFSFWDSPLSLQGLQNQLFAIFMLMTVSDLPPPNTLHPHQCRDNLMTHELLVLEMTAHGPAVPTCAPILQDKLEPAPVAWSCYER
jgi:ATP-binding cassette subfamily G (WHITE) protein 2 (PDR)